MDDVLDFFKAYASAFEQRDVPAISALWTFPAHVTSDGGDTVSLVAIPSADAFTPLLQNLLEMYRRVGCKRIALVDCDVQVLSPLLRRATVRWGLRGLAELSLYEFTASYVLMRVEQHWRAVSAVSHDELKAYRRFIGR